MTIRLHSAFLLVAGGVLLAATGCGDDDATDGGGRDGGGVDGGGVDSSVRDGGGVDGSVRDGAVDDGGGDLDGGEVMDGGADLTITGTVFGEGASDFLPDAGVTPWPEGGVPDGAVVTPGGRIIGAAVALKSLTGATISTGMTNDVGQYTLTGPADALTFLQVSPTTGYGGSIRVEQTRGADYEAYIMVLPDEAGLERVVTASGVARNVSRGIVACGFNPVDNMAGGDGADLGTGITHDPPFNITATGVILGNRLAPLCLSDGSNPPGALSGATCTMEDRAKQIFFPNVLQTMAPVVPLHPASGTCSERFGVSSFLTAPNTLTVVNIDCVP